MSLAVSGFTSPTVAGVPQTFTVTARDANGGRATGYRGTVHLTSSDGQATLPLDHTFTPTEAGSATLTATLRTAGGASLTATDTARASLAGSQTGIQVIAAPPATMRVDPATASIAAGGTATFAASGADAYGNAVTIASAWSASGADAQCGAAGACTSSRAGSYTVTATAGALSATASLTVTTAVLDHLVVSPSTQSITYGGSATFSAKGYDRYENEVPTSVAWSSAPAAGCDAVSGKCTPLSASASGYTVTASAGSTTGTGALVVGKAAAAVSFSGGPFTYNGAGQGPSAATTPSGLALVLRYTGATNGGIAYDGAVAPAGAGSYMLTATIADTSYDGSSTTPFVIARASSVTTVGWAGGASATFDGTARVAAGATRDGNGATVANPTIGYAQGATALLGAPTNAGDYTATATFAGNDNYQPSAGSASLTIAKATPTVTVAAQSVTYDGTAHGTTASVAGVGGADLGPATVSYGTTGGAAPVNAGSYSATGTYAGSANYAVASGSAWIDIGKATSLTILGASRATYSGSAYTGAAATATTVGGAVLGQPVLLYLQGATALPGAPANAGDYVATATFAGTDNYFGSSASAPFTIAKADPTVTAADLTCGYTGAACVGSASAMGVGGAALTPVTIAYSGGSAPIGAGTTTYTATYAGSDNYNARTSAAATITVNKATPIVAIAFTPDSVTFDARAHPATASVTGLGSTTASPSGVVTITYRQGGLVLSGVPTDAGGYLASAAFASGDPNYTDAGSTEDASLTIAKATPTVTVAAQSVTYDGTAHGTTASVAGVGGADLGPATVSYGTTGGAAPVNAGSYSATGTYAGSANYAVASGSAWIDIGKATSLTTATAAGVTYSATAYAGASASTTGIGGAVLVPPALAYLQGATALPGAPANAGDYVATATFAGTDNYFGSSASAPFTIAKADPTVTAAPTTCTYDGTSCIGSGAATGVGGAALSPVTLTYAGGAAPSSAGSSTYTASYAGGDNYNARTGGPATITIAKATPTVTVAAQSVTYDGTAHGTTASVAGVGGADLGPATVSYGTTGGAAPVNAGSYSATGTYAGSANYAAASGSATIVVSRASATVTIVPVPAATYDAKTHGTTASVSGVGGLSQSVPVTYNGATALPVNAGTYTATATFAGDANHAGAVVGTTIVIAPAAGGSVEYTGAETWITASATTFTTTVTSSATVEVLTGDVTTATVSFSLDGGATFIAGCRDLRVTLLSGSKGSAACGWTATVPATGSRSYTVTAVLGGNYAPALDAKIILVKLSESSGDKTS